MECRAGNLRSPRRRFPNRSCRRPCWAPKLIPEITMSGSASRSPVTARWTQSVGVPLTKRKPFGAVRTVSGRSSVSEFDAPLRSRSGATTVSSRVRSQRRRQALDARREITVVVGEEDAHRGAAGRRTGSAARPIVGGDYNARSAARSCSVGMFARRAQSIILDRAGTSHGAVRNPPRCSRPSPSILPIIAAR